MLHRTIASKYAILFTGEDFPPVCDGSNDVQKHAIDPFGGTRLRTVARMLIEQLAGTTRFAIYGKS
ncbi:hypothetical protein K227x_34750 [Rubripirellula lacrimiformis]|uniref:Uncharacterized protein n=1 Tax=Rubripirellula lacrimiformis TaxID=1930273 RepID=A0A517ND67_9BACT|nr:hypothetical protein K227x_34750 [Rubripirellula lacrimiformis]